MPQQKEVTARAHPEEGALITDEELRTAAEACWEQAASLIVPEFDEDAARAALASAVKVAVSTSNEHLTAQRVLDAFVESGRRLVTATDPFTARLNWTIWLMAQRLFATSLVDPLQQCTNACREPNRCSADREQDRAQCLQSFVFPFLHLVQNRRGGFHYDGWNVHKAAKAIVRGIEAAAIQQANGLPYVPSERPSARQSPAFQSVSPPSR